MRGSTMLRMLMIIPLGAMLFGCSLFCRPRRRQIIRFNP